MTSEKEIEQAIQDAGKNAPRLTPELIDNTIERAIYTQLLGTTMTICTLVLKNGFMINGESAAASLDNFNKEIGKTIAYNNAREKIWQLEGYLLRDQLHKQGKK